MDRVFQISVIIPNYNRKEMLLRAIHSVLSQTFPPLEVLVCDDGSTEYSSEILNDVVGKERVRWIDCGRNGLPAIPRNIGIKNARGNWISFLDNDDYWHPEKLEKQVKILSVYPDFRCVCTNASMVQNGEIIHNRMHQDISSIICFKDLLKKNPIVCSSMMVEKKLLEEVSVFPEERYLKSYEDYALWVRLGYFEKIYFLDEPLVFYTDHPSGSIRAINYLDGWDTLHLVFDDFKKWCNEKKIDLKKEERRLLNELYRKIKRKGSLTFTEEFSRRVTIRIEKYVKWLRMHLL